MTNHPHRARNRGFVVLLANGNLWKSLGASGPAIFHTSENAQATVAGFSGRGALANPKILRIVGAATQGACMIDGYYTAGL